MKRKLEDIIKDNREEFDGMLPEAGHEARFAQKLERAFADVAGGGESGRPARNSRTARGRVVRLVASLTSAAALICLVVMMVLHKNEQPAESEHVRMVARYYTSQLEQKAGELIERLGMEDEKVIAGFRTEILSLSEIGADDEEFRGMNDHQKIVYLHTLYASYSESLDQIGRVMEQMPRYAEHSGGN